ncbi:MAG: class I SAM-dependent methyltransferase [Kofleriaceae bacterium]|nr:class I SAM-dependent methyltransferase [Kofleriaceae bacterium]
MSTDPRRARAAQMARPDEAVFDLRASVPSTMSSPLAHPLIWPMPRPIGPIASAARHLGLAALHAGWARAEARLALELPDGTVHHLGGHGPDRGGDVDAVPRVIVRDDRTFLRVLMRGELGAGEAYVAGDWDTPDLVAVVRAFLRATAARGVESRLTRLASLPALWRHRRAANSRTGAARNIHAHYDLGNSFYDLFLDAPTMMYSCALWPRDGAGQHEAVSADALTRGQAAKLERLCARLDLGPRDHLLEIGSGWGGMAIHAARTRGCRVTTVTISRQQHERAQARIAAAGLSDRVTVLLRDYRDLGAAGRFDKLVSIEMIEAVGYEFLPTYFEVCARALRPGGRMALQAITMPDDRFDAYRRQVDWMQTYIFPGSLIPSLAALRAASASAGLRWHGAEDIGPDYAPTLRAWREVFEARRDEVRALGFDEPFIRTWRMYLAFSEAAFAERTLGDHQIVLTRG